MQQKKFDVAHSLLRANSQPSPLVYECGVRGEDVGSGQQSVTRYTARLIKWSGHEDHWFMIYGRQQ